MHCIVRGFPFLPSRVGVGSLLALQALAHLCQLLKQRPTEFHECTVVVDDFPSLQVFDDLDDWVCFEMGMGQYLLIPIFSGMNIHLPAILMFTRGTRF